MKKRKASNDLRNNKGLSNFFVHGTQPDYLFVRAKGKYVRVNFSELICIKGKRGYLQIVTETVTHITMNHVGEIAEFLPKNLFCRIHHSWVVAVSRIRAFDNDKVYLIPAPADKQYKLGMARLTELPVGAHYRTNIKRSIYLLPSHTGRKSREVREAEYEAL